MLSLFVSAGEEDYDCFAFTPEVDPISGSEVYASFGYALSNGSDVAEISFCHTLDCNGNACGSRGVETAEPTSKRASSAFVVVFTEFDHVPVTHMLPQLRVGVFCLTWVFWAAYPLDSGFRRNDDSNVLFSLAW